MVLPVPSEDLTLLHGNFSDGLPPPSYETLLLPKRENKKTPLAVPREKNEKFPLIYLTVRSAIENTKPDRMENFTTAFMQM